MIVAPTCRSTESGLQAPRHLLYNLRTVWAKLCHNCDTLLRHSFPLVRPHGAINTGSYSSSASGFRYHMEVPHSRQIQQQTLGHIQAVSILRRNLQ